MLLSILALIFLILLNGFFAMSEMAVVAARKSLVEDAASTGNLAAQKALALIEEPTQFLSTVQIAITLVAILTGALGGANLAVPLSEHLEALGLTAGIAQPVAFAFVVSITVYLSLVIGELTPKRIALQYPERITQFIAPFMTTLARFTAPLVAVLSWSTHTVLGVLRMNTNTKIPPTEGEIMALIEQGIQSGVFAPDEQQMIESVMRLDERTVEELMKPRTTMRWLDLEDDAQDIRNMLAAERVAYLPVTRGGLDNVVGMLYAEDLVVHALEKGEVDIEAAMRKPLYLPEHLSATRALAKFRSAGVTAAIVINEFGGTEGTIDLLEIAEAIIGDVDNDEPRAIRRADGSMLVDGLLPIFELSDLFDIDTHDTNAVTVAGLVLAEIGHIPTEGEVFTWRGVRFEVVDMDGNRIDKLLMTRTEHT